MSRTEELKMHLEKLAEIKAKLKTSQEEWVAYNRVFNTWIQTKLGIADQEGDVHLTEILMKWDETNDQRLIIPN